MELVIRTIVVGAFQDPFWSTAGSAHPIILNGANSKGMWFHRRILQHWDRIPPRVLGDTVMHED